MFPEVSLDGKDEEDKKNYFYIFCSLYTHMHIYTPTPHLWLFLSFRKIFTWSFLS